MYSFWSFWYFFHLHHLHLHILHRLLSRWEVALRAWLSPRNSSTDSMDSVDSVDLRLSRALSSSISESISALPWFAPCFAKWLEKVSQTVTHLWRRPANQWFLRSSFTCWFKWDHPSSSRDWQDQKLLILWNRSSNQIEWWRQARQVLTANTVSSYMLCILRSESKSAVQVPFRLSPADCVSTTCNCVFAAGTVALVPSTLWNKPSSRAKHNSVETFGDLPRSWQQLYFRNVAEILQTSWCLAPKD